jgi:hypothetical protein
VGPVVDAVVEVEGLARVILWLTARGVVSPSTKMLKKNVLETVRFILPRSTTQVKWPPRFVTLSKRKLVKMRYGSNSRHSGPTKHIDEFI